jgi:hypothetical protein
MTDYDYQTDAKKMVEGVRTVARSAGHPDQRFAFIAHAARS